MLLGLQKVRPPPPPPSPHTHDQTPAGSGAGPKARSETHTGFCTWDALALDGPGDDGQRLVSGLAQRLAQLLHAVAVHDDGVPAAKTQEGETIKEKRGPPPNNATLDVVLQWEVILLEFPKVNTTLSHPAWADDAAASPAEGKLPVSAQIVVPGSGGAPLKIVIRPFSVWKRSEIQIGKDHLIKIAIKDTYKIQINIIIRAHSC